MINLPHVNLILHEIIKLHEAYLSHIASLVKKNIYGSLKMDLWSEMAMSQRGEPKKMEKRNRKSMDGESEVNPIWKGGTLTPPSLPAGRQE